MMKFRVDANIERTSDDGLLTVTLADETRTVEIVEVGSAVQSMLERYLRDDDE